MSHIMNDRYLKVYGAWAGLPNGVEPDYSRCCEKVCGKERGAHYYQCTKPRGHGPDGAYCKRHDPAVVEARVAASEARSEGKLKARRYEWHGRAFYDVLVEIAQGHNDARGLAQAAIDRFNAGHS